MRNQLVLAATAAAMFFICLGSTHLWDVDEAIFSQAAREMFERGDYVVPRFNHQVFPDKPPLMYWLMISAYHVFGPTELAARFWSAMFGVGSVLLTYHLGRLLFSPRVGFWSGFILATNLNFNVIARAATPDSFLVFFSTLAVLAFVWSTSRARVPAGAANERNAPWSGQTTFEPTWRGYALMYAAMGCGVLDKGPVAAVLPAAVVGLFLLIVRAPAASTSLATTTQMGILRRTINWLARVFRPGHFLATFWSMRPVSGLAIVLAIAAPWYVWVGVRTDGKWLVDFFGVHNFGRFLNAMENHRGPFFYYLVAICIGFFPWSVLAGPAIAYLRRQMHNSQNGNFAWRPGYILIGCWLTVWVGFFSLAGTKLPSYVVPAYPALALFTGCVVDGWLRDAAAVSYKWHNRIWATVALVGVAMIVALPILARTFLASEWYLALGGVVPLAAAVCGWYLSRAGSSVATVKTLAGFSIVFPLTVFAAGAVVVDRHQDSHRLAEHVAAYSPNEPPTMAEYDYFRPSLVYYLNRPIDRLSIVDRVGPFFRDHPGPAFMFTSSDAYDEIAAELPPDVVVLESKSKFLRPGKVLLLGRKSPAAATAARPDSEPQR